MSRDRSASLALGALLAVAVGFLSCLFRFPGTASAQTTVCPDGTGAGQCREPLALGVNQTNGDLFVRDFGNRRIDRFDSNGDFQLSFGWGVRDGSTEALQSCGPAATPPIGTCFPGLFGSGTGQFGEAERAMAVDSSGSVYVGYRIYGRVQKFDSNGNFLRSWGWDVVESGPDNDTAPPINEFEVCVPAQGDVCKVGIPGDGPGQIRGQRLSAMAIGPGGALYVSSGEGGSSIQRFDSNGQYLGEATLEDGPGTGPNSGGNTGVDSMAIDPAGNIYVTGGNPSGLFKYTGSGGAPVAYLGDAFAPARSTLAFGPNGRLYEIQLDAGFAVVGEYDVSGAVPVTVRRYGYGHLPRTGEGTVNGMAPTVDASGEVYLSSRVNNTDQVISLPSVPPGPVIAVNDPLATSVGSVRATLRARINPEGKATTYRIQYVDQDAFEDEGGFGGPSTRETPLLSLGVEDFAIHSREVTIGCPDPLTEASEPGKCLTPETEYRFRVLAEHDNGDEGNGPVEGQAFTTSEPLEIGETWATEVGATSARLHAEANPFGVPATGFFEYVDRATCEADEADLGAGHCFDQATHLPATGEDQLDFGGGEDPVEQSAIASGLEPGTAYRYRIAVDNDLIDPVLGATHTFTTFAPAQNPADTCANAPFRTGAGARLPDCRAYELVSPLDKDNGDIVTMFSFTNFVASYAQSAAQGGKLTYSSLRAFGDAESAPLTSQYLATRDADRQEWVSTGISPPRGRNILAGGLTLDNEFKLFSEDLCAAWLLHDSDPPKAPGAVAGYANLYKRDNCGAGAGGYEAITTAEPPAGTDSTGLSFELQGISGDGQHAIYRAAAPLTATAKPGISNVYDSQEGEQRLVCVLPGGGATSTDCSAGSDVSLFNNGRQDAVAHAVSEDGSRVFWEVRGSSDTFGQLYVRLNGHGTGNECANPVRPCTVAIGEGQYWNAAADGSAVLYTTPTGELRVYDVDAQASQAIAGQVEGVLGAGDDLTRVYFASREAIGGEGGAGKLNLYLYEKTESGQEISFIGELVEADKAGLKTPSPLQAQPVMHTAHTTPSGDQLVFMSLASLTGADNLDAEQGEPVAQVFRYDATSGDLECVSCNPSGGRPEARVLGIPPAEEGNGILASGRIATAQNQLHASRVVSDDGSRVFFESTDALTLGDTNGVLDVYQWEAVGKGDCEEDSASFNPAAGGCVSLISSGKSPEDSVFVDASADGTDVFIATGTSLLSYDPGLVDVYDARVGGGFPAPPEPLAGCEGEACQGPIAAPNDPTPASASYSGPGNVVEEQAKKAKKKARRCPKGKRKVKRKGKVRCQKKHRHKGKRRHHRRARNHGRAAR